MKTKLFFSLLKNGLLSFCKKDRRPKVPSSPLGLLKGVFSISATKKVHFSQGNLIATIDKNGTPIVWKFARNQYDFLGKGGANETIGSSAGDVDLFGWSTAKTKYGICTSSNQDDYSGDFVDWGEAIVDSNTWYTLSKDEWTYLLFTASRMKNSKPCYSNSGEGIIIEGQTYNGLFLYPDDYNGDVVSGSMTWKHINDAGIVFLPAAGWRDGSTVEKFNDLGSYWSSSPEISSYAYDTYFDIDEEHTDGINICSLGASVRLITEC